ncbi:MAG: class I SAM-dependent methyltransferase [Roseibium sp.]|uniref:hypothetical protein n=1 Tax=Roseibium sp. TaxID=1936156 RepID=UPI002633C281|nr:hypothetical protein [Roseibium sp.]MCV0424755.1 class I SAM-dependent methyltransferase [Roseibium sp.]
MIKTADRSTEGMTDYNANSRAQKLNAIANSEVIADLAVRVQDMDGPLNFTDYGCGPGQSAIETVRPALNVWRSASSSKQISVCHADQPGNDWNALMALVFGDDGYMSDTSKPLVQTAIGSFYDRMMPDQSVSIATCFFASHWLSSSVQLYAPDTIWFADLTGEARKKMWQLAERDWIRFLKLRARELQSGGYLFVSALGAIPEAGEINDIAAAGRGCYRALQEVTVSMVEDGLLKREAADNFVFGLWFLTEAEASHGIENDTELKELYEIDTIKVVAVDDGGDLFGDHLTDPQEYGRLNAGYTRAFAGTTLRRQLFEPSSNTEWTSDQLEAEFFRRFEALYAEKPSKYAVEQWHLHAILRRK